MAGKKIYNIDVDQAVTPIGVRDALIECFYQAHCQHAGFTKDDPRSSRDYCKMIIKKGFESTDGDYENPTKESIMKVMDYLADYSKSFRDPTIIQKHYMEILELVKKL